MLRGVVLLPRVEAFCILRYDACAFICGEVAEWPKARDSKSRRPQKGLEGSNPSLSAILRPASRGLRLAGQPFSPASDVARLYSPEHNEAF